MLIYHILMNIYIYIIYFHFYKKQSIKKKLIENNYQNDPGN